MHCDFIYRNVLFDGNNVFTFWAPAQGYKCVDRWGVCT